MAKYTRLTKLYLSHLGGPLMGVDTEGVDTEDVEEVVEEVVL